MRQTRLYLDTSTEKSLAAPTPCNTGCMGREASLAEAAAGEDLLARKPPRVI
jgi:hypothetical protein